MAPKIAIVYYSKYGHIEKLAQAEKKGIESAGGTVDVIRIPELDVTRAESAPIAKQLESYDAFLFGIPTRYGNFPAPWKAFWDSTGGQWGSGAYIGKYAGVFVSTATPGGGQESTVISSMSTLAHHGIIYVPLGYGNAFPLLAELEEVRGGSPWGAGTYAGPTGARQPTEKELALATLQGKQFYETVSKVSFSK